MSMYCERGVCMQGADGVLRNPRTGEGFPVCEEDGKDMAEKYGWDYESYDPDQE